MTSRWWLLARRAASRAGTVLASLLIAPVRHLVGYVPRDPHLVVMGGNAGRFIDNSRYLFLGLADDPTLRVVWITGDRSTRDSIRAMGHSSELRWSWPGVRSCARAGWYVYGAYLSDVNYWLSQGARSLNLWHGVPMKAIEFDINIGPLTRVYRSARWSPVRLAFPDRYHRPDYVLSTSPMITERCFTSAFRVAADRCLEFGYPRADHFFDRDAASVVRGALDLPPGIEELWGYFPTWRDDGYDFLAGAGFSFDHLNEALARANRYLIFKEHPNFAYLAPRGRTWSHLRVLDAANDLYELLPACDVLVTDYSSVAFDYLVLDRPILYFVPDHDRYVEHRNVYFSFEQLAAGPLFTTCDELYEAAASGAPVASDAQRRRHVRELVWNGYDGRSIEHLRRFLTAPPPAGAPR